MIARQPGGQQLTPPSGQETSASQNGGRSKTAEAASPSRRARATRWSRAIACVCFELAGPELTPGPWTA